MHVSRFEIAARNGLHQRLALSFGYTRHLYSWRKVMYSLCGSSITEDPQLARADTTASQKTVPRREIHCWPRYCDRDVI
jgi:hypothetical protein